MLSAITVPTTVTMSRSRFAVSSFSLGSHSIEATIRLATAHRRRNWDPAPLRPGRTSSRDVVENLTSWPPVRKPLCATPNRSRDGPFAGPGRRPGVIDRPKIVPDGARSAAAQSNRCALRLQADTLVSQGTPNLLAALGASRGRVVHRGSRLRGGP